MEIILNKSLKLPSSNIDRGRVKKKIKKRKKRKREKRQILALAHGLMRICWFITTVQTLPRAPELCKVKSGGGRRREIKPSGEAALSIGILFYVWHAGKPSQ